MKAFVVTVDFRLKPGAIGAFRKLIDSNAADSCRLEPGCRRFDVLVHEKDPERIFLYEIYDDRAAFDAHLKTAHFDIFNRMSAEFVLSKEIVFLSLVCEGGAQEVT